MYEISFKIGITDIIKMANLSSPKCYILIFILNYFIKINFLVSVKTCPEPGEGLPACKR